MQRWRDWLGVGVLVVATLGGCATGPGHRGYATETVTERVEVFYATDRTPEGAGDGVRYTGFRGVVDPDRPYDLGVCRVEIQRERNHDKPAPLPTAIGAMLNVASTASLDEETFYQRLREKMWYAGENETFVFVHGFNNSFDDCVMRAAELWYDTGFEGPPVVFSWPSRGGRFWRGIFGYFADSETMKWSAEHLEHFLKDLVDHLSAEELFADEPARIHLIAHSMGAHALVRALSLIADDLQSTSGRPIFCEVILAAPDIDRDLFRDMYIYKILKARMSEHYTLYASGEDSAIKTSESLQIYPRVGDAEHGLLAVHHPDFDTIDASSVHSKWFSANHDYFVTEPRMIRDLIQLLIHRNRDPGSPARLMHRVESTPGEPWKLFPDDENYAIVETP